MDSKQHKLKNWDIIKISDKFYETFQVEKWKYDWVFTIVWEQVEIVPIDDLEFYKNELFNSRCCWTWHFYIQDRDWRVLEYTMDDEYIIPLSEDEIKEIG